MICLLSFGFALNDPHPFDEYHSMLVTRIPNDFYPAVIRVLVVGVNRAA